MYTDVLREYLDYHAFMVRLTHVHAVDTRHRDGPGDELKSTVAVMGGCSHGFVSKFGFSQTAPKHGGWNVTTHNVLVVVLVYTVQCNYSSFAALLYIHTVTMQLHINCSFLKSSRLKLIIPSSWPVLHTSHVVTLTPEPPCLSSILEETLDRTTSLHQMQQKRVGSLHLPPCLQCIDRIELHVVKRYVPLSLQPTRASALSSHPAILFHPIMQCPSTTVEIHTSGWLFPQ